MTAERLYLYEQISLRELARRNHLQDHCVFSAVNHVPDLNLSQVVNDFRVREPCRLLTDSVETVLEISLASGVDTKSNFNREFMRMTGTSQSDWRRTQSDLDSR
tara:strand:- start:177 stop:488 length:312 start_codon:yes stop_codon:yes gene_type:complete